MSKFEELYKNIINKKDEKYIENIAKNVMADMKKYKTDINNVDKYLSLFKVILQGYMSKSKIEEVIADVKEYVEKHYEG